jgi:methyl-accepting chemotaxis protein
MEIKDIKAQLEVMNGVITDTVNTAIEVNRNSRERKAITDESLNLVDRVISSNGRMKDSFVKIQSNLQASSVDIDDTLKDITGSVQAVRGVVSNLGNIKSDLSGIESEIHKLTRIVDEIRRDTDKIFTLALNASIVSSKYSSKSGVFDILANKLNEMSNFISQNLENIVKVVRPITEGIQSLIKDNEIVIGDVSKGSKVIEDLPAILAQQKDSITELLRKIGESANRIEDQKKLIVEAREKVLIMNSDAQGAISGSDNVRQFSENLQNDLTAVSRTMSYDRTFYAQIDDIRQKSATIWKQASGVNEKSQSQLEFTNVAVHFITNVLTESEKLKDDADVLYNQSSHNKTVSNQVAERIVLLKDQMGAVSKKISDANMTIQRFNVNYKQIDNILEFLKNILKSMHLIGMYSRIESSRDINVFEGFMNISANISTLQKEIQNNIPNIEKNIYDTHQLISSVTGNFARIYSDFALINENSDRIINELRDMVNLSVDSENVSHAVLNLAREILDHLRQIETDLGRLPEVTKVPVEGSAANMERGKRLETICAEMMDCLKYGL